VCDERIVAGFFIMCPNIQYGCPLLDYVCLDELFELKPGMITADEYG